MAVSATNLTQGPGTLYYGDVGAVEPLGTEVAEAPDDAVWTDVGGTSDGVSISMNLEYSELSVDQMVDVPARVLTKRDVALTTNLAEPTLDNLVFVMNGGDVTSGTGFKSFKPVNGVAATQPTYCALLFDGRIGIQPSRRRRIVVRRALSTNNVEFAYKKDEQTVYSATFSAHAVSDTVAPWEFFDEIA